MKKPEQKQEHRWSVYRIRGTPAVLVGSVSAPDEATAIERAIEQFGITDQQAQKRLMAVRSSGLPFRVAR